MYCLRSIFILTLFGRFNRGLYRIWLDIRRQPIRRSDRRNRIYVLRVIVQNEVTVFGKTIRGVLKNGFLSA